MQSWSLESHSDVFHQMIRTSGASLREGLAKFWEKGVQLKGRLNAKAVGQEQIGCVRLRPQWLEQSEQGKEAESSREPDHMGPRRP